jgi:hypothetical protein
MIKKAKAFFVCSKEIGLDVNTKQTKLMAMFQKQNAGKKKIITT